MKIAEIIVEADEGRRGFLKTLGKGATAAGLAAAKDAKAMGNPVLAHGVGMFDGMIKAGVLPNQYRELYQAGDRIYEKQKRDFPKSVDLLKKQWYEGYSKVLDFAKKVPPGLDFFSAGGRVFLYQGVAMILQDQGIPQNIRAKYGPKEPSPEERAEAQKKAEERQRAEQERRDRENQERQQANSAAINEVNQAFETLKRFPVSLESVVFVNGLKHSLGIFAPNQNMSYFSNVVIPAAMNSPGYNEVARAWEEKASQAHLLWADKTREYKKSDLNSYVIAIKELENYLPWRGSAEATYKQIPRAGNTDNTSSGQSASNSGTVKPGEYIILSGFYDSKDDAERAGREWVKLLGNEIKVLIRNAKTGSSVEGKVYLQAAGVDKDSGLQAIRKLKQITKDQSIHLRASDRKTVIQDNL